MSAGICAGFCGSFFLSRAAHFVFAGTRVGGKVHVFSLFKEE